MIAVDPNSAMGKIKKIMALVKLEKYAYTDLCFWQQPTIQHMCRQKYRRKKNFRPGTGPRAPLAALERLKKSHIHFLRKHDFIYFMKTKCVVNTLGKESPR